jgi:hypothetical protein
MKLLTCHSPLATEFIMSLASTIDLAAGAEANVFDDGHLRVEYSNYYVACLGKAIKLPRTEFLIISRLARSPNESFRPTRSGNMLGPGRSRSIPSVFTFISIACAASCNPTASK